MAIMDKLRLDGKKIFVTGGARGIGMNYAKAVAEAGADVALVDIDLKTAKETAVRLAKETGCKFKYLDNLFFCETIFHEF